MPLTAATSDADGLDSIDPEAVAVVESFLDAIDFPKERKTFRPADLYELISKRCDPVQGSVREWQRLCRLRDLRSVYLPGGYVTTRTWLVMHLAGRMERGRRRDAA